MNFENMASEIIVTGKLDMARHGVTYRKGKTVEDLRSAVKRAMNPKISHAKLENEIGMLSIYLERILKKRSP